MSPECLLSDKQIIVQNTINSTTYNLDTETKSSYCEVGDPDQHCKDLRLIVYHSLFFFHSSPASSSSEVIIIMNHAMIAYLALPFDKGLPDWIFRNKLEIEYVSLLLHPNKYNDIYLQK